MTDSEQKIYDKLLLMEAESSTFRQMATEELVSIKELVAKHEKHIETLIGDRNKVTGILWFGGVMFTGFVAVYEFFIKK
jgi:hypothetical protein